MRAQSEFGFERRLKAYGIAAVMAVASGLAPSEAGATSLTAQFTVDSMSAISERAGQEVDTPIVQAPFAATAQLSVFASGATGPVSSIFYADPRQGGTGSFLQTGSTVQFAATLSSTLDALLGGFNTYGPASTQSFVTVTQNFFAYPNLPATASYGWENLVFTSETTNAQCDGNSCYGFDEVKQITIPGPSPQSAGDIRPSDFSTVASMIAAAQADHLPITFTAYARDYALVQGPVQADAGGSLPTFTTLSGILISGTVTSVPEPSSVLLFGTAGLFSMLVLQAGSGRSIARQCASTFRTACKTIGSRSHRRR